MKSRPLSFLAALALTAGMHAAPLQTAKVTRVFNDVRIHKPGTSSKDAAVGSTIQGRTSLQTGANSRSELKFQDDTLTRLGQNSVFSFRQGTRDLQLDQGTLLLQVPKRAGGARIRTATVTAAVTGTTIMMEYYKDKWCKIIVLEGSLDVFINKVKRQVTIKAGEMLVMPSNSPRIPNTVSVDIARLQQSSALAGPKFFASLPPATQAQINQTVTQQQTLIQKGALAPSTATGVPVPTAAQTAQAVQTAGNNARPTPPAPRWWDNRGRK